MYKGIRRNIDNLGRVVIPKEMRKSLGISNNSPVDVIANDDHIEIRPIIDKSDVLQSARRNLNEIKSRIISDYSPRDGREALDLINEAIDKLDASAKIIDRRYDK